ncbi:MAG: hypothetical protein USCGTAYLOR_01780 [Chromatiales bacterium USCg_Taylor]|nr:MAG: hypothetical protein USCGTAYLOR_01780 [Chromatiales bacterium USCg_Taylor]
MSRIAYSSLIDSRFLDTVTLPEAIVCCLIAVSCLCSPGLVRDRRTLMNILGICHDVMCQRYT